jgi:signal transduction histidine kinase
MDLTQRVRFDSKRLRQLLANLVNNAVVHGDPTEAIEVDAEANGAGVEIRVTNQGEPIPPHIIGRLFEPFVRPNSENPRPGLGLGLYIASEIAKGHGGSLSVTSSRETGTTFMLRLPHIAQ